MTWLQPKSMALYECSNQIICNKHILLSISIFTNLTTDMPRKAMIGLASDKNVYYVKKKLYYLVLWMTLI